MTITNFRDIGGYETSDGLIVKKGYFYRSSPIVFKNDGERAEFAKLGIRTILDLRSSQEMKAVPDDEAEGCTYIPCSAISEESIGGGNFDMAELIQTGDLSRLTEYVQAIYKNLPFQNKAYQMLFELMRREETPIVFHCSAGKDRTGFAAYLILKTLGVPDNIILKDYMLSNVYRKEENDKILAHFPGAAEVAGLLYVKEAYLQSSMDAIAQKYGAFKEYLWAEYGVTEAETALFRERYLRKKDR